MNKVIPKRFEKEIFPNIDSFNKNYFYLQFKFMKIIPAYYIINKALIEKKINKNTVIIESSSGNFAYGLSVVCSYYGIKLIIIGDKNIDKKLQNKLRSLGAKLVLVDSFNNKNIQTIRLNELQLQINKHKKNYFWPKQYDNPDNYKSYNLLEKYLKANLDLKNIDYLISPVGSGGNSAGFYNLIKKYNKNLKLIGVDSVNSVIFGKSNGIRNLRGPGSSIYPKNVKYKYFNKVFWVTDKESFTNAFKLFKKYKFKSSPCVGAVDLVSRVIQSKYKKDRILAIFPEDNTRYLSTALNLKWLKNNKLLSSKKRIQVQKIDKIDPFFKKFSYMDWDNQKFKK